MVRIAACRARATVSQVASTDGSASVNDVPDRDGGRPVKTGLCREPSCAKAASGEPIALYPGPGEHCPTCGSRLEPVGATPPEPPRPSEAAEPPNHAPPEPAASAGPQHVAAVQPDLITLEAYQRAHERMMATLAPAAPPPRRSLPGLLVAVGATVLAAGIVLVGGVALGLLHPAAGRAGADTVRVCGSSITERLARDVARSYAAGSGLPASRFGGEAGGCDVRFAARAGGAAPGAVAHDGIVIVVNPQNTLARLTQDEVRRIYTGGLTDWSQAGWARGAIEVLLPDDASDEARALSATILRGATPAASVRRLPSSADVVRVIASASGRRTIGVVAFSAAVPAKVLALAGAPAPSVISIAQHRYPLALSITVDPEGNTPRGGASGLVDYAHSEQAQAIVVRDGLIAKKGF
jgi:hypothetical protein